LAEKELFSQPPLTIFGRRRPGHRSVQINWCREPERHDSCVCRFTVTFAIKPFDLRSSKIFSLGI